MRAALLPETETGAGQWIDLAGLFAPEQMVEKMLLNIENKTLDSLEKIELAFLSMHNSYSTYEWTWAVDILQKFIGRNIGEITPEDIIELTNKWKTAVIDLDHQLKLDAGKEFSDAVQTGYGIDGNQSIKHADFTAVRGTFEQDNFVLEIENHIKNKTKLADDLINRIKKIV